MAGKYLVAVIFVTGLIVIMAEDTPICPIPKKCPEIDPVNSTVHVAHKKDCTKFYKCLGGKEILFKCPLKDAKGNRLHFNRLLQVCDWPQNAGCDKRIKPACPKIGSNQIKYLPHEYLLNAYYKCKNGKKILQHCNGNYPHIL